MMTPKRALDIVTQVLKWKNRKGFWPVPKNDTERKLIHEAFVVISGDDLSSTCFSTCFLEC